MNNGSLIFFCGKMGAGKSTLARKTDADYWESYFIGVYDATMKGYNENRGNSSRGFLEGMKVRAAQQG
jgi:predicted kinase